MQSKFNQGNAPFFSPRMNHFYFGITDRTGRNYRLPCRYLILRQVVSSTFLIDQHSSNPSFVYVYIACDRTRHEARYGSWWYLLPCQKLLFSFVLLSFNFYKPKLNQNCLFEIQIPSVSSLLITSVRILSASPWHLKTPKHNMAEAQRCKCGHDVAKHSD